MALGDSVSTPTLFKEAMQDIQQTPDIPNRVTVTGLESKVKSSHYYRVPDTTVTVCALTLENGFTVIGHSACVDPSMFNQAMGEKIAYVNALDKIWELEGYRLRQQRHELGLA